MKHSINGVAGTLSDPLRRLNGVISKQVWTSEPRQYAAHKNGSQFSHLTVRIRFDDCCNNGHATFSITADSTDGSGGCLHDQITQVFPELAPLIKWHLCSSAGPMHYVANTAYQASNLAGGYAAGQVCAWNLGFEFDSHPIKWRHTDKKFVLWLEENYRSEYFEVEEVPQKHGAAYTFKGYDGLTVPFSTLAEAEEVAYAFKMCSARVVRIPAKYSLGKPRDLQAARRAAIWPEATDAQLCLPKDKLTALLEARLPELIEEFKSDITACGFSW